MINRYKLNGKNAVVCGGHGLIGKQIVQVLIELGAHVYVLDKKGRASVDVTNIKKMRELIRRKDIHVWVNAAYPRTRDWGDHIEDVKESSWKKNVDMHMNTYCLLTKEIAESMRKKGIKGSIINFGSTYGVVGPDFDIYKGTDMTMPAAYAAIKGGIVNFSRYMASFYGEYGIRVNCICPGGVFNNQPKKFVKEYNKRTPLRRMARAEEIATATAFLCSEAASYITGATLMVDGGWTCR